jgi:pyruvate formate lyase activating enzyme
LDEDGVLAFLEMRKKLLDAVVISGGEPTVQPDLAEFLSAVKGLGYKIKLDTNGSNPAVLEDLLQNKLIDYLALDLKADPQAYPSELYKGSLSGLKERLAESIEIIKQNFRGSGEFRTTCAAPFIDETAIEALAKSAAGEIPLFLQRFRPERILDDAFMAAYPNQPNNNDLKRFQDLAGRYLPCRIR